MQALFVGGTGFIGSHAQTEFTEHGYGVAVPSRSGGEGGEAYNAAERQTAWLDRTVELATVELDPGQFPLYVPFPLVCSSAKLAALGWECRPLESTFARTVADYRERGGTGEGFGVDRATEERLLADLTD